jgi:hypothetical protein
MQYAVDLADPLLDVRNVVESFRSYHVTPPDWDETLRHAIAALSQLQALVEVDIVLPGLLPDLDLLLTGGLERSPQVVEKVATQVANILAETTIPGPTLEDDDWSFGDANLAPHGTSGADPENLARSRFTRRSCDCHHASAGPEYIIDNQRRATANLRRDNELVL